MNRIYGTRRYGNKFEIEIFGRAENLELRQLLVAVKRVPGTTSTVRGAVRTSNRGRPWSRKELCLVVTLNVTDPLTFGRYISSQGLV